MKKHGIRIKNLKAKEILNSNGKPTVEVEMETKKGAFQASAPSGVSTGKYEAKEVGIKQAIKNIEKKIAPKLVAKQFSEQKQIDDLLCQLDGAENKANLGANAMLAVSIACCRAFSQERGLPLFQHLNQVYRGQTSADLPEVCPRGLRPMVLCLEGGRHGESGLSAQEFMVVPKENVFDSFKDSFESCRQVYETLSEVLKKQFDGKETKLGLEGGFVSAFENTEQALDLLLKAINKTELKNKAAIALDMAASEFFEQGRYNFEGRNLSSQELLDFYAKIIKNYPIVSIEDPFSQEDWQSWTNVIASERQRVKQSREIASAAAPFLNDDELLIVGDDLTVSNPKRIKTAKDKNACNAVILKPNQIGTVTEAIEAAELAKSFGWKIIVSHRAGETQDDFIADFSYGIGADFIKAGAPKPPERMAKYNRLIEIENYA